MLACKLHVQCFCVYTHRQMYMCSFYLCMYLRVNTMVPYSSVFSFWLLVDLLCPWWWYHFCPRYPPPQLCNWKTKRPNPESSKDLPHWFASLWPQAFQRQVHESLTQLELINKQYRRLARENRTDSVGSLKQMVHGGNQRWDDLQKRVASILRRLKVLIKTCHLDARGHTQTKLTQ